VRLSACTFQPLIPCGGQVGLNIKIVNPPNESFSGGEKPSGLRNCPAYLRSTVHSQQLVRLWIWLRIASDPVHQVSHLWISVKDRSAELMGGTAVSADTGAKENHELEICH
jgi:hypothetical protein